MRPKYLHPLLFAILFTSCSLEDIEKLNECSHPEGVITSSFLEFDKAATEASQDKLAQDKCPESYPQCILLSVDRNGCSRCEPGKLFCSGQCVAANTRESCGNSCDALQKCSDELNCINGVCACENGGFSNGKTCNRPDDDLTCGASHDNPEGINCKARGQICQNQACICENGGVSNGTVCNDPTDIKTCGASVQNPDGTDCTQTGQICMNQACTCENGGITNGSVCNDPTDIKTCGANRENPNGTDCTLTGQICRNLACVCENGGITNGTVCNDPADIKTCGANRENPDGTDCEASGRICKHHACACPNELETYTTEGCVKTTDPKHCGASDSNPTGTPCRDDQKCIWSLDAQNFICACTDQTFEADNACVDPNNDITCGATPDAPLGTACSADQKCINGECQCTDPQKLRCGDACIYPNSDPKHCGARGKCTSDQSDHSDYFGKTCDEAAGQECISGQCTCQGELIYCDGKCINPSNNSAYCGRFNSTCDKLTACSSHASCKNGTCECAQGYAYCGSDTCVPNGETHCGARGGCQGASAASPNFAGIDCTQYDDMKCESSTGICVSTNDQVPEKCGAQQRVCSRDNGIAGCGSQSQFTDSTCATCTADLCGSACTSPIGTNANCSACGDKCRSGQTCQATQTGKYECRCSRAQDGRELTACDGKCVDLQFSQNNCGACGASCSEDEACIRGVCQSYTCDPGQYFCLGACRNQPQNEPLACDQDKTDLVCKTDTANCDGMLANGCEINTATDADNCGSCGNECAALNPACQHSQCCHKDGDISLILQFLTICCNHKYKKPTSFLGFKIYNEYKCATNSPGNDWELAD